MTQDIRLQPAGNQTAPVRMHFQWVDNAKAILIFLVVLGHFHYSYAPVPFKEVIYAFHVPAFLFITGFLLPADFGRIPAGGMFRRWIATYLRAYVFFSLIAILLWWGMVSARAGAPVNPLPAVWGALYGVAGAENLFVHQDQPLWYFPFLIVSLAGAWVAASLAIRVETGLGGRPGGIAGAAVGAVVGAVVGWGLLILWAAFGTLWQGPRLPWALDIGGFGALALFAGLKLRGVWPYLAAGFARPPVALALALVSGAVLVAASAANGNTNLNGAGFGQSGILFAIGIIAGSTMIMAIASLVSPSAALRRVSGDTLTIFALHIYLVRLFSGAMPHPASPLIRLLLTCAAVLAVIVICLGLARILRPVLDRYVLRRKRG